MHAVKSHCDRTAGGQGPQQGMCTYGDDRNKQVGFILPCGRMLGAHSVVGFPAASANQLAGKQSWAADILHAETPFSCSGRVGTYMQTTNQRQRQDKTDHKTP